MVKHLLSHPIRCALSASAAVAVIGLAATCAEASSMPRALSFRTEVELAPAGGGDEGDDEGDEGLDESDGEGDEGDGGEHGAVLRIRGEFRSEGGRVTLVSDCLPLPESGEYVLVLYSGEESLEVAYFAPEAEGAVEYRGSMECDGECGDMRPFGLALDYLELLDGDVVVADAFVSCPVRLSNRGRLAFGERRSRGSLNVAGSARRSADGEGSYEYKLSFRGLEPGHYELFLSGEGGELPLPFEVSRSRRAGSARVVGDESIVDMAALFTQMQLVRVREEDSLTEIASGPLDCRR